MATRPTLRLLWQHPLGRLALLTFLLAAAAAWYVTASGGWVNALHLPPVLDASTPRSQNGFILEDIQTPGADDSGDAAVLLIRPAVFPKTTTHYQNSDGIYLYGSNFDSRVPPLQASVQTAAGDVTPLNWKIIGTQAEPQFYRIEVPGGYSNECRYIDVTLVPNTGPFPRWRITRLPKMRRVIPDAPAITSSLTRSGITTTAQAWRSRHWIFLQVRPILPPNSHQWELARNEHWSEWETFNQPHRQGSAIGMPIVGRRGVFTREDVSYHGALTADLVAPYRSASQDVRMDCTLLQFETYDEQVTFHNLTVKADPSNPRDSPLKTYAFVLTRPVTLTTPSGIAVTLPSQGGDANLPMGDKINLKITIPQTAMPSDLPQSPLVRQFGKPVTLSVLFAPPYDAYGHTVERGETRTYSMWPPKNPAWHYSQLKGVPRIPLFLDVPPVLKDLTIIIRQHVDLQTIPMIFTVPVSDTPPPDVH